MRRIHCVALGTVAIFGFASVASAADLPIKAPMYTKAPVIAPVTNWQGFYVGGNVGYGWDPASATFNPTTYVTTVLAGTTPTITDTGPDSGPVALSVHPKGWLGGGQLGYNWQQNSVVYGLEADIDWSGMQDSASAPWFVNGSQPDNVFIRGQINLKQQLDYFGTLRGRLGWANDSLLLYGTGGLAWGHVTTTFNVSNVTEPTLALTSQQLAALQNGGYAQTSQLRWGFALGAGLEWMVAHNWSVKAEYLFIDLGDGSTLTIPGGSAQSNLTSMQVARVGLNYLFH